MKRGIFLDRDGTLVAEKGYLHKVEDVVFFPGVAASLRRLQDEGFVIVIVTNQSGVGRGYYTETEMHAVNEHIERALARDGVHVVKTYYAPESPEHPSRGRKPSPQFLFDARDEFGIDLSSSYMIGDKMSDVECGWNAGVKKSILVRTGYGLKVEDMERERLERAWVVNDIPEAEQRIRKADSV